jgi:uncharacterized protein YutE (UPF0331/DUF86 family)
MDDVYFYQNEIGNLFYELEKHIRIKNVERVDIRFPRGVLRTAKSFREELDFIDDTIFKTNLAYHLMLTDIYRWLLNRFDLRFTAKEMLIKEGICTMGGICGDIAQYTARNIVNRNDVGYNSSFTILKDYDIIDNELKNKLKRLWGQRNKLHLSTVRIREFDVYDLAKYNDAIYTWKDFKERLQISRREGII